MSISAIQPGWWNVPFHKDEKIWIGMALAWCIFLTVAMPWWHIMGSQNASQEYYKITTDDFEILTDQFVEMYTVGEEAGIPIVAAPPGSDIFLYGRQWQWYPILKLKMNETYRLHLSAIDVLHGFSVYPINMNFEAVPGYDSVLTITPTTSGDHIIICNEFCGIEHHQMFGKIIVEP